MKSTNWLFSVTLFWLIWFAGCTSGKSISGTWQYDGGIYNGKTQKASKDFTMKREYTSDQYTAFMQQPGTQPVKYASGKYKIDGDSLLITGEYSSQPSQLVGKTIAYYYTVENGKLTTKGKLPSGMVVEEYWKKVE